MIDFYGFFGIDTFGAIPLSECVIVKPYLLEREGLPTDGSGSVLLFLLPYYTKSGEGGNVSMYAVAEDYHEYARMLFSELCPRLRELAPEAHFAGYADHSPILEVDAAAKAGLGVYGENGLLISKPYSSFVFIGGIYTDLDVSAWERMVCGVKVRDAYVPGRCCGCGACRASCPAGAIGELGHIDRERCFSAVTQKKRLTENDEKAVADAEYVWGCDICQLVCPMTKAVRAAGTLETPLSYFKQKLIKTLDEGTLSALCGSGEFSRRAFSWRGADVVRRNLRLRDKKE